jgi:DNA helicase-2/ATP-dependent DNA helicase PcrA
MSYEYLADLNREQRRAVKHGIDSESATTAPPLLVIAGAGSGKTKTLAHRVAHLVVNGVDPHRILLLTFTRRAAEEMIRRVKRITTTALGTQQVDLPWSGTFHAVGARLLREYATQIGLKPSFTILDRSDAADLMNLVRHDLGQSTKKSRFPKKDTCLSIYSSLSILGSRLSPCREFPMVCGMGRGSAAPVPVICGSQAAPERSRLRRLAAVLG